MPNSHDVFVSYAKDAGLWVQNDFVPALERVGLRVCLDDSNFVIGWPTIMNIEHAVKTSSYTVIVMTPGWDS